MPYDLFISYSRHDNEHGRITQFVDHIKRDFASFEGNDCRQLVPFFDQQEIHGMSDWRQRILQGLRESRLLLACLTPSYLKSEYCEWEFVEYLKYEIGQRNGFNGVAPIYFVQVPGWEDKNFDQNCTAWISELRRRQNFDLRPWHDHGEKSLRETVVQERMGKLNRQIVETLFRSKRAEASLGNVDAHNPHFIGRTANLRMLRENFVKPGHIGVVTAVNGLGGLGKTGLSIEYAHAFADEYGGGRWQVRCAGKDDLRLALAELAIPIGFDFTEDEKKNADLKFERTRRELKKLADARAPHRCLLLLDNVDKPALLAPAQIARLNGGDWLHVLATTRLGENELHGAHRDRSFLAIDELPPDDALALIESYQPDGRFNYDAERDAARQIVRLLGGFTLAVESAAVYLGQFTNDVTCASFLARLKNEGLEGLDTAASQSSEGVLHGEKRLGATLQPTLERLSDPEKLALEYAALLPPDHVPLPWLRALVAKSFPEMELDAEPGYPDPWKNALRRLFSMRLLQTTEALDSNGQPRVARVHRLLQELVAPKSPHYFLTVIDLATFRASRLWNNGWTGLTPLWEIEPLKIFTHHLLARGFAEGIGLANWLGRPLMALGHHAIGHQLFNAALHCQGNCLHESDSETGLVLSFLALFEATLGNLEKSRDLRRRLVQLGEQYLSPDDPTLATRYSNLAPMEEPVEARRLLRLATDLTRKRYGPNHYAMSIRYANLANVELKVGNFDEARMLLLEAIGLEQRQFGREHHTLSLHFSNLSSVERAAGKLEEARRYLEQAIEIKGKHSAMNHPDFGAFFMLLAEIVRDQGLFEESQHLFAQSEAVFIQHYSDTHPNVQRVRESLASFR